MTLWSTLNEIQECHFEKGGEFSHIQIDDLLNPGHYLPIDTVRSGLRFSKDYIEEVSMESDLDIEMPIPILPDEESLLFLPELKFTKI